jgi:hypothetical protein
MFLWPFVLFNSAASFTKQDFESMDSTLFFLFSYRDYSNFGNSGFFFAFLFRLLGILKLAAILVEFWREIVVLVRVLLIESSPRFTNRVQSAFY